MVVKYRFRLYLFTLAILGGFSLLVYRLWYLQIERHEHFVKQVPGQKQLRVRIPGVRGEIKDRNGITLVRNKASFEVRINLRDVMDEYKRQIRLKDPDAKVPKYTYKLLERGIERERTEDDIAAVFNEMIVSKLNEMGLAAKYNADQDLRVHYRSFRGVVPWVYRSDLTFEEFSRFAEHNLGLPGVSVAVRPVRFYPYGSLACHILGYVSLPDDQRNPEERKQWDFFVPDDFGVTGIEKTMDNHLIGKPGVRTMLKNEKGALVGEVSYEEPRKGNDVFLTIDARIQYIAEKALRDAKIGRGSIVIIDPNNGEVLAMASVPSYDPNKFIPSISQKDFEAYMTNKTQPLNNKAVQGFAPGSTFKIPISFAGCLADIQQHRFTCSGGVTYGNKFMRCWIAEKGGAHGTLDLTEAIQKSCNSFFYQYGNRAGIDNITRAGKLLGVGEKTGIELDFEDPGVLPNPAWLRLHRPLEKWSAGYTANTSIGQGMVLATPLQMASVTATVANGGVSYRPHLLKRVVDDGKVALENPPGVRSELDKEGFSREEIDMIRKGMWKVVNADGGTARAARMEKVEVAGKTGTAQFWRIDERGNRIKDNHTWFITFLPFQNPKFACCVLVQGAKSGGGCAAPVARHVLEQALALDQGSQFDVASMPPMSEAVGSFNHIESVSFDPNQMLASVTTDDDGDVGSQSDAQDEVVRAQAVPMPSIRPEEDAAGSRAVDPNQKVPKAIPLRRAKGLFERSSEPQGQEQPQKPAKRGLLQKIFGN